MSYANARRAYVTAAVQTVPPAQLVVLLYDGLVRNLDLAALAIDGRNVPAAHASLLKAQDIVAELDASLDTAAWSGGRPLQQLYRFLGTELVEANVTKDAARVRACRELVAPLAEAWRQAAGQAQAAQAAQAQPAVTAQVLASTA